MKLVIVVNRTERSENMGTKEVLVLELIYWIYGHRSVRRGGDREV